MIFRPDVLQDQVAIITGGGTGIGRVMALEFARVGAHVVIASRRQEHLDSVAEEIRSIGRRALAIQTDVRQPEQIDQMVQQAIDEFGRIDILVNNAAGNFRSKAEELSVNAWNTIVNIDLNGTFYCSRAVAPHMIRQGSGRILNMIGTVSWQGSPYRAHVGAAKAGIWNLTMSLAYEWAKHGITVNNIAPGTVPTEGVAQNVYLKNGKDWDETFREQAERVPLRRLGTPEEIAWSAIYLASPAAAWITGTTLVIDGGGGLGRRSDLLPD